MMIAPRLRALLFGLVTLIAGTGGVCAAEDYSVTTFAGAANVITGADGTPGSFNNPYGVAIDAAKNIYVTDTLNNTVRKITPGRVVSTLAGTAGQFGSADGAGAAARFNFPVGIAVDSSGNVYVSDSKSFTIRKISPAGVVSTFAGMAFQTGATDGAGSAARFFLPSGLAIDGAGNLYVADSANQLIRKITPAGVVSTLAGGASLAGYANGPGATARFSSPFGVAVDGAGNVLVADSGNHAIRKITPDGIVSTLVGNPDLGGAADGPVATARFNQPRSLAVDAGGNIFVSDFGNSTVRHITPNGIVSTIAGTAGIVGEVNSVGPAARFYEPVGIVVDGAAFYLADSSNNLIRRGQPASTAPLPVIVLQPFDQEVSAGQSVSFGVAVTGSGISYQWLRSGVPIVGATNSSYTIATAQLDASASYVVRVSGPGGSIDSTPANLTVTPVGSGPIAITARPLNQNVPPGQSVTFSVTATGPSLSYQWFKNGGPIAGAVSPAYTIAVAQGGDAATYSVRITSGTTTETLSAKLTVGGVAGSGVTINTQPASQSVNAGQGVTFTVSASGSASIAYQWLKNDSPITGATAASYTIAATQTSDAGSYAARVSAGGQNVVSATATLTVIPLVPVGPTARLSNLSVRTAMAAGQNLIVGFFVDGGSRNILVRAAGPALGVLGVGGAMADPRLDLYNGSTLVLSNENWPASLAGTFSSVGAFAFPANSLDAAFLQEIGGSASVHARGTGAGILLVEAYDTGSGNTPRLVNVSARNQVGTGDDILIAGFNIAGTGTKQLLFRAVGPKLAAFGVTGFLVDPKLELYSGSTKLNENDSWSANLAATFTSVGAFALDAGSRDAALLTTLDPGSYTVQVSGVNNGTGEALIEIYEVP